MPEGKGRRQKTLEYLRAHPGLFDRLTKDGRGGRVRWGQPKPRDYDGRECLPWNEVQGRYWYLWPRKAWMEEEDYV